MKTPPLLFAMAAAAALTGCNRDTTIDVDKSSGNPPPNGQVFANQERDKFIAAMDRQRAEFDAKINELATKSADLQGDAKVNADKALADLRVQRDAMNKHYDELKSASGDTWDKTKADFQSAWDSLQKAYDQTRAKLTSTSPDANK